MFVIFVTRQTMPKNTIYFLNEIIARNTPFLHH